MSTGSERDVFVIRAAHVKTVRVRELIRVAIRRAHDEVKPFSAWDRSAVHLDVDFRHSGRQLHGAVVSQHLFDSVGDQCGVVPDEAHLVRMSQESEQSIAEKIGRGLIAGDEKQHDGAIELVCRKPPSFSAWRRALSKSLPGF